MDKMLRIRGEIPTFRRCCMCLPLRHGLIGWGYIRLLIGVLLLVAVTKGFLGIYRVSKEKGGYEAYLCLFGFFITLAGADIVLNVVFIYAGHKKDIKMLKAYYIYSFILWILIMIIGVSLCVDAYRLMKVYDMEFKSVFSIIINDVVPILVQIVIQAYVILLVRSEYLKLLNNDEFTFVNNATELACMMKYEEDNIRNGDVIANEDMTTDENIRAKRDVTAITSSVSDRDMV